MNFNDQTEKHGRLGGSVRMAVDCMGGDHGPSVVLPACEAFLSRHPDAELILVGRSDVLRSAGQWPRCRFLEATEVVAMDDSIEVALRRKKQSSMRLAIELVKQDEAGVAAADVCVSAGNTGALMAVSRYVLKTLDGIDRPAISGLLPNQKGGNTTVLDLGANVDCTAAHLLQFALMGSALVSAVEGKAQPSVGLLNIGEESIKGSEVIKQAGELLRSASASGHLNFYGNVEGNDMFKGTVDIVVCDGFAGNVALKAAEGLAALFSSSMKQEFNRNFLSRLCGLAAGPVLRRFKARVDYRRYNGAALLGLRGLVFKSHGSADAAGFEHALERAYDAARHGLLAKAHERIRETLQAIPASGITESTKASVTHPAA